VARADRLVAAKFLRHHLVVRKAFGDERAEHALRRQVHLGHEVDGAFLLDVEVGPEAGSLDLAGAQDRFDGGRQEEGISQTWSPGWAARTS